MAQQWSPVLVCVSTFVCSLNLWLSGLFVSPMCACGAVVTLAVVGGSTLVSVLVLSSGCTATEQKVLGGLWYMCTSSAPMIVNINKLFQ